MLGENVRDSYDMRQGTKWNHTEETSCVVGLLSGWWTFWISYWTIIRCWGSHYLRRSEWLTHGCFLHWYMSLCSSVHVYYVTPGTWTCMRQLPGAGRSQMFTRTMCWSQIDWRGSPLTSLTEWRHRFLQIHKLHSGLRERYMFKLKEQNDVYGNMLI